MHHAKTSRVAALEDTVRPLLDAPREQISDEQLIAELLAVHTAVNQLTGAVMQQLVAEAAVRNLDHAAGFRTIGQWLRELLHLDGPDASSLVHRAATFETRTGLTGEPLDPHCPATAAAQHTGAISPAHADEIRKVFQHLPEAVSVEDRAKADELLADAATTMPPSQLRQVGQRILAYLDPDGNLTNDSDRQRRRRITLWPQGDNLMSKTTGWLTPMLRAELEAFFAKWAAPGLNDPDNPDSPHGDGSGATAAERDAAAERDNRTVGQRQHDALDALLRAAMESRLLGEHMGASLTVILTMTVEQLETASGVATTASGGLVPVKDALERAETIHPVLTLFDHRGVPLHFGRSKRFATRAQRLALIAGQGGCTRPGCTAPPDKCEVHHARADYSKGGNTDIEDLILS